ncbi:hypothetical protein [Polaromonas sp. LjRoot131]|uniref:hypothetical protein n=1 Tax=Polaromonas sp. LjRoot131 TaxID=3342262 RepID=UPI003ECE6D71
MPFLHAVVWLDHHQAQLIQFNAEQAEARKLHAHSHATPQHGSEVRTQHEFFGDICDALDGMESVLVTGGHTAQADFRRYVDKHRPALAPCIAGWETVDHPSEAQLLALGRQRRHQAAAGLVTGH